jgi:predicted HD superfamily hydrolase involved in NAD metabolism
LKDNTKGIVMLRDYIGDFTGTGNITEDVLQFLSLWGHHKTAEHCLAVAAKAKELAEKFESLAAKAEQAGYVHDISAVIPNERRLEVARSQLVDVLAEETQCPMILHQKLSVVIAREAFGVTDHDILSAIGCHTTLKANATRLDKVVFLADKMAWDQDGIPPYMSKVTKALEKSLDDAVLEYLNFLWERRHQLQVIHPWFVEAREDLLRKNS